MKIIKNFIIKFIEAEYIANCSQWNFEISDESLKIKNEGMSQFYHAYCSFNPFQRAGFEFESEEEKNYSIKTLNKQQARTLFQIKHYKNPELGSSLEAIVQGDDLWACYVSYDQKGGRQLYFSSIFFVADTKEGLKIIYEMSFDSDKGKWYHPHEGEVLQVLNPGKLISVEKYQAPEEESSLADYNAE